MQGIIGNILKGQYKRQQYIATVDQHNMLLAYMVQSYYFSCCGTIPQIRQRTEYFAYYDNAIYICHITFNANV